MSEIAKIFVQRRDLDMKERYHLEDHGGIKSTAVVASAQKLADLIVEGDPSAKLDFTHPPQEWALQASVQKQDGTTFNAVIPLFLDEIGDPPAPGETVWVVYSPQDASRIRLRDMWRGPKAGAAAWRVPSSCPSCGAPVDQSIESVAPHPACRMCNRPLPCER
jgi:hypothetical protein